jgi:hypothetical protein
MSNDTWKGGSGLWTTAADWTGGVPTSTSAVIIGSGSPIITAGITIASLSNAATVDFTHAGSSTISGSVTNAGFFDIDDSAAIGGTNLTVGGTFTNTGYMQFGYLTNSLTVKDTIKVGALVNSIGEIDLNGGKTSAGTMLLDVTGTGGTSFGVANEVTGTVDLSGFSTIEFQSGGFTSIASGATLSLDGSDALVADAAGLTSNSALTKLNLIAGTLDLSNGARISTAGALNNINQITVATNGGAASVLAIGAGFTNNGAVSVDSGAAGGSVVTVNGVVTNDGDFDFGSGGLRKSSTVTVKGFTNFGDLSIGSGLPTAALALLNVTAVAGFGETGVLQGDVAVSGNSEVRFTSGQITSIAFRSELDLFGQTARIADATAPNYNSALAGLKDVAGVLKLAAGNALTTGALTIDSFGEVDVDTLYDFGGDGGSKLTVNGAVTNTGTFNLGNDNLTGSSNAIVSSFVNTDGSLTVDGSFDAPERSLLTVKSAAGFGVAGQVTGGVDVEGDASIQFASGQITTIDADSGLKLVGPQATVADLATPTTNSALTGLANIAGELDIEDGVKISTTGALVVGGSLMVDASYGGSVLAIKQALIVAKNGEMSIGSDSLEQTSEVSAAALDNAGGVSLAGGTGATEYAVLDLAGAAGFGTAGQLTGAVNLAGRARIQFTGKGVLNTIDIDASLFLDGATAVITNSTSLTTNSALDGLAVNHGVLNLSNGANVSTSGGLNNTHYIQMDSTYLPKVSGGSKLTLGGVLTNSGTLDVGTQGNTSTDTITATGLTNAKTINLDGASSTAQAIIDITTAASFGAAGALFGTVTESGYAAIHFASGQIGKIVTGATLDLEGAHAFVSEGTVVGNSALDGLTDIAGDLALNDGARVVTTAGLSVEGIVTVDSGEFGGGGTGGSDLNVGGALTDNGIVGIGNSGITQAVVAFAKLLTNDGELTIGGGASATTKAELDVAGAAGTGAAGVLSGTITLSGFSALRFASGLITTLQAGASLTLNGAHAVIANGTAAYNNALTGLKTLAGNLTIDNGAGFSTTGALSVTGEELEIDTGFDDLGGSKIAVGGQLTNSSFGFDIGNSSMTSTSQVTATSFVNNGQLTLAGGGATTAQALLDITGAAGFGTAGALQGDVDLSGYSAVEFGSGAITTNASGAQISLNGAHAFIEKGATNSNSALAGLTSNDGYFSLENGAVVAPTGNFTNNSQVYVDGSGGTGGSQFKVGGVLTNNDELFIGSLSGTSLSTLSAASLINNDSIDLTSDAELAVSGSVVNDGEFDLNGDTETLAGAVTGTGSFNLETAGSNLEFEGSVSSGQTVTFSSGDQLKLADATAFAGAISGFGAGDTVDLTTGFEGGNTATTFASGTGTLTLTNSTSGHIAQLSFGTSYALTNFTVTTSATGTVIAFHA